MSTAFAEPPSPPPMRGEDGRSHTFATVYAGRLWGRVFSLGVIVSVLVHLVPFLIFRSSGIPPSPFSAAGPRAGDIRAAAGGGSGLTMVEVRVQSAPAAVEETPVPVPVPVPEEVVVVPEEVAVAPVDEPAPIAAPTLPGTGGAGTGGAGGPSTGDGSATGTGTGLGGGGTEASGQSGMIAPTPRGLILPPSDRPRSVRGREVTVWVFVSDRGRVLADSTRLDPPTPDSGYNRRLMRSAADWIFEPARRAGQAVGAWYPFQVIL